MNKYLVYVFIEGRDDKKFCRKVIEPLLKKKYRIIRPYQYQNSKNLIINNLIKKIQQDGDEYIFLRDKDKPRETKGVGVRKGCISEIKKDIKVDYPHIDESRIVLVIRMIESWYLAGLDDDGLKRIGIEEVIVTTDDIGKGKFKQLKPDRFSSKIDFMIEILKNFSINTAVHKNKSFRYFHHKYLAS